MSDVEKMLERNWEQRRHAEDYQKNKLEELLWEHEQYLDAELQFRCEREVKKMFLRKTKQSRTARDIGRTALVMVGVSALMGWGLLCPVFGLISFLFYIFKLEDQ